MISAMLALAATNMPVNSIELSCAYDMLSPDKASVSSSVSVSDLTSLNDIGGLDDRLPPHSLSPDGTQIALIVRKANPTTNRYCSSLVILDAQTGAVRRSVAVGDTIRVERHNLGKLTDFASGAIETMIPLWSPDGHWLAYLERKDGAMQLFRLRAAAGRPEQVSHSPVEVQRFFWGKDAGQIIIQSRPELPAAEEELHQEGKNGYRYDDRWTPAWKAEPFPRQVALRSFLIDVATGQQQPFDEGAETAAPPAHDGTVIEPQNPAVFLGPKQIRVSRRNGGSLVCSEGPCVNARAVWRALARNMVYFQRSTGWGNSLTEIVSWNLDTGRKRTILKTEDRINGCEIGRSNLICAIDGPSFPKRLEQIHLADGQRKVLFDPNPQWQSTKLGSIKRLMWRNDKGLECFGYLVLPPGATSPEKLPLIIVGYLARGFLRGGTGDLFPIQPLASAGYAVLVYNMPPSTTSQRPVADMRENDRLARSDWADSRSTASAILTAVDMLAREEIIDPDRVGLTGFSDGVEKGTYALIHHDRFKAAAFAACCVDPAYITTVLGPQLEAVAIQGGFTPSDYANAAQVREYSLAANAQRKLPPVLIQAGDREYLISLEVESALRRAGNEVELYVFPDEYHVLWQPAHRLAAYQRNLDWFKKQIPVSSLEPKKAVPPPAQ